MYKYTFLYYFYLIYIYIKSFIRFIFNLESYCMYINKYNKY